MLMIWTSRAGAVGRDGLAQEDKVKAGSAKLADLATHINVKNSGIRIMGLSKPLHLPGAQGCLVAPFLPEFNIDRVMSLLF